MGGSSSRRASTVTGDHTACKCLVDKGRYHVLSDAHYNPSLGIYDSSDLDFNIPMMVVNLEEGDVPPANVVDRTVTGREAANVVDRTVTGCEAAKRTPEHILQWAY